MYVGRGRGVQKGGWNCQEINYFSGCKPMGWSSQVPVQPGFCQSNRNVRGNNRKLDKPGCNLYGSTFAFEANTQMSLLSLTLSFIHLFIHL